MNRSDQRLLPYLSALATAARLVDGMSAYLLRFTDSVDARRHLEEATLDLWEARRELEGARARLERLDRHLAGRTSAGEETRWRRETAR